MTDNLDNEISKNQLSMAGEGFEPALPAEVTEEACDLRKQDARAAFLSKIPIPEKQLPPVIREFVTNAPKRRKVPTFLVCMECLAALATRLRFEYAYEHRLHMPLLYLIIEGEPSSGKGFANEIVKQIMGPTLTEHDNAQRRLEQEYREKKQSRKANEKIGPAPKTIIREIPANVSKTVLVRRADMYQRILGDTLTFWMYAEELAQLNDAGHNSYSQLRTLMRVAYDLGSTFGLDFASDNSYSAIADINMCYLFLATPGDVNKFMDEGSISGGNVTRTIIYTMEDDTGYGCSEFKQINAAQKAVIDKTLQRMMEDTYVEDNVLAPVIMMDMSWIEKEVRKWCDIRDKRSLAGASEAYNVFYKRSSLSAFRATAVFKYLYDIEGVDEATSRRCCKKLYRWLAELIHTNMLRRWGKQYDYIKAKEKATGSYEEPKTLYEQLTVQFSRDQLKQLIDQNQMLTDSWVFLSKWRSRGWIRELSKNSFEKVRGAFVAGD